MDCEKASPNVIQLYEQQQYHHQEQNFASCAIKTNDSFVREKREKTKRLNNEEWTSDLYFDLLDGVSLHDSKCYP